jgi:hypothetical protein
VLRGWNKPPQYCQIPSVHRALWPEYKAAYSVGDLLLQHLEALEWEAEVKGGVQQLLADHFAKVYKVSLPLVA